MDSSRIGSSLAVPAAKSGKTKISNINKMRNMIGNVEKFL
jgi:hypothetical protein